MAKKKKAKVRRARRKADPDFNQAMQDTVRRSTESAPAVPVDLSRYMAEMGRRGGKIGGRKRAENMSEEERSNAAARAARARWEKRTAES